MIMVNVSENRFVHLNRNVVVTVRLYGGGGDRMNAVWTNLLTSVL